MIYDTSIWPGYTPDLFWALSDEVLNIGRLSQIDATNDCVEYHVDTDRIPDGEAALWNFNALRNLRITTDSWPPQMRSSITKATLCIGSKAIETVAFVNGLAEFTIFRGKRILPLFVVSDEIVTVRIHFKSSTPINGMFVPKYCAEAQGLLCRIKTNSEPFFVGASESATVTWDGKHCVVRHGERPDAAECQRRKSLEPAAEWDLLNNPNTTYENLWAALPLSDSD